MLEVLNKLAVPVALDLSIKLPAEFVKVPLFVNTFPSFTINEPPVAIAPPFIEVLAARDKFNPLVFTLKEPNLKVPVPASVVAPAPEKKRFVLAEVVPGEVNKSIVPLLLIAFPPIPSVIKKLLFKFAVVVAIFTVALGATVKVSHINMVDEVLVPPMPRVALAGDTAPKAPALVEVVLFTKTLPMW
jgi:hypothetical protein